MAKGACQSQFRLRLQPECASREILGQPWPNGKGLKATGLAFCPLETQVDAERRVGVHEVSTRPHASVLASVAMSISAKTKTVAILGHPVGHSLSPAMHNAAFEALGLDFVYVAHDVAPEQLAAAMVGIRALGYRGLSVTIPHKVAAMSLVDELDPIARSIGCINTVINDAGKLTGYNSDGMGALGALRAANADPEGEEVLLLGSGGAARAIAMTLALEAPPKRLTVLGIDAEELSRLVADLRRLDRTEIEAAALCPDSLAERLPKARLLLQTTPLGMAPLLDRSPVPAELLHRDLVVFDAVYTPRQTRFIRDAALKGATTVLGLEMFLGQALVQFQLFTGQKPPTAVMRAVVESRLSQ